MIFDDWFKRKFKNLLFLVVSKFGSSLSYLERERIVFLALKVYSVVFSLAFFLFLIYFFSKVLFFKLGFERLVILLLSVIMVKLVFGIEKF